MSKKNKNSRNNKYVVINLITEYGCPLNGCKYAVASHLSETELKKDYSDELADYEPYIYMTEEMLQPINESRRNDEKWKKRYLLNENPAGYVDGVTNGKKGDERAYAKDPVNILIEDEEKRDEEVLLSDLRKAFENLSDVQKSRVIRKYKELKTYRQIASEDGVIHTSVESSIKGALRKLRESMKVSDES